jgi:hypothetical protein
MSYLEEKYISFTSPYLRNFKRKGEVYNFSCHVCGDSEYDKRKARGYLIHKDNHWVYKCHNCGITYGFGNFLKSINTSLYDEYRLESFQESNPSFKKNKSKQISHKINELFETKKDIKIESLYVKCSFLDNDHKAIEYLENRKISKLIYKDWFYCDNLNLMSKIFDHYVNTKFIENDPRIVIPIYDDNQLIAIIARSLDKNSKLKYIIMKKNKDDVLLYSKEKIDNTKQIYVVEGPIDSLFIENSVAVLGSDLKKCLELYPDAVYIFDNQPKNKEIIKKMEYISDKVKMVIWPKSIKEKDINEMYCANLNIDKVIKENTFDKLQLKLNLANWRRI